MVTIRKLFRYLYDSDYRFGMYKGILMRHT